VNFNTVGVVLIMAGSVFIYSAVKDKKPQDLVRDALKGGVASKPAGAGSTPAPGAPGTPGKTVTPTTPLQPFENRSAL